MELSHQGRRFALERMHHLLQPGSLKILTRSSELHTLLSWGRWSASRSLEGVMPRFESLPGSSGSFMVRVLGGFALFWEGGVLRVPRASQRLLAFLALQSRMVKRAAIAGTLWPDASESHASANLRSALARLQGTARKALAANKLELGLAEGIVIDVRDAQGLARRLLDPGGDARRGRAGHGRRARAVGRPAARLVRRLGAA